MATAAVLLPSVTPPDYHRIVSPTLSIPANVTTPIPVGLLACQRDPLLQSLTTTIVSAQVSPPASAGAAGKKGKRGAAASASVQHILEVILHDTVLFPEGGGQPSDIGVLTAADGEQWEVLEVKRRGGTAVHYVKIATDTEKAKEFAAGATVCVELGEKGCNRRLDHMCVHTSQHLLSALLDTHNLPTLSWSLTAYPAPCYVDLPRFPTPAELTAVQDAANALVFAGRRVHIEVAELDAADADAPPQLTEAGRTVGRGLPKDYTGGVKRVVVIDGVDRNPCCGTHLPSLHNLQLFLLPPAEGAGAAPAGSGPARLYFLSGPRLLAHLGATQATLTAAAATLSCGPPLVATRVAHVVDERRRAEKRLSDVEAELAGAVAGGLVERMRLAETGAVAGACRVHHVHRTDEAAGVLPFLGAIATAFEAQLAAAGSEGRDFVVVVSSSPASQNAGSTSVVLVLGKDAAKVKIVGDGLKTALGVKGGGKGTRWSGKWTGVWKAGKESAVVDQVLKGIQYPADSV